MTYKPDIIYLLHGEGDEGTTTWCDDIPNDDMETTKYANTETHVCIKKEDVPEDFLIKVKLMAVGDASSAKEIFNFCIKMAEKTQKKS